MKKNNKYTPMNTLEKSFENDLIQSGIAQKGDGVFIGCSGGPDSVALTQLFAGIHKKWNLKLGLLHFNHGLRGKSADQDQRFVERLARKLGVPFYSEKCRRKCPKTLSIEEFARKERYEFFSRAAKKFKITSVALAHTLDDQAETVLMRILQGTGAEGLASIRRVIEMNGIQFIRPLLNRTKKEILLYLQQSGCDYRKDETNEVTSFLRNKIRLKVIPRLERDVNPQVKAALAKLPQILEADSETLEWAKKHFLKSIPIRKLKSKWVVSRNKFSQAPSGIQFRLINDWVKRVDKESGINFKHWQEIRLRLKIESGIISLPKNIDLAITPSKLSIYRRKWIKKRVAL